MRRPTWRPSSAAVLIVLLAFAVSCEEACKAANAVTDFIDSISDGAPCEINEECLGGRCFKEDQGFPGGYCTTLDCDKEGCSGLSSECFRTEIDGQAVTSCFELCDFDGACERADEGYVCVTLQDTAVCMPPDVTTAAPQGSTGSSCSANPQCNGDNATCLTTFFGGYCSQLGCTGSSDCLGGNPCLSTDSSNPDAETACFLSCEDSTDCRFQYSCQQYEGVSVCLEGEDTGARNPDGADDGAPCTSQIQCKGGTCNREAAGENDGDVANPGGYCTTRDCADDTECNGGVCIARARSTSCFKECSADSDCRDGYVCKETPEGPMICDTIVEAVAPDPAASAFDVQCGSSKSFSFTIPDGSEGFFVGPYTQDGRKIEPRRLTGPGVDLDIVNDYSFMAINPELLGSLAPILFPGSDQPEFQNTFGGGEWTLTVESNSSDICFYAIPQPSVGTQLDINLYFVGVPGLPASQAANDNDVSQVMQIVRTIYGKMDIDASVANYVEASQAVADSYSIVRDFNDIFNLVATSEAQGTSEADQLAVNVFLINDFNISEAPGLLGVSAGIPGVAGLHGNSGAGLVFSTASLGEDNRQLGQTMAHEIGHFLGLRHTTEHGFGTHDPITDTPTCVNPNLAGFCPDSDNFMFAFALGSTQTTVTPGQTYVVQRNPLVK